MKGVYEPRDRMASFDLSIELLQMLLKLPEGTKIERFFVSNRVSGAITIVVAHPSFPMVHWGEWIPEIRPYVSVQDGKLVVEYWDGFPAKSNE